MYHTMYTEVSAAHDTLLKTHISITAYGIYLYTLYVVYHLQASATYEICTHCLSYTHKQMHDDEAWSQFAGKSKTSFSLSQASRQKWWLPAFKTRLCLQKTFDSGGFQPQN